MPAGRPARTKPTPERRASVQTQVKRAIRAEMHQRDLFPADLGAAAGVSEREMQRRLEPADGGKHPSVADLVLLDDELLEGVLTRLLADRGFVVVQVPVDAGVTLDLVEHHEAATQSVHSHLLAVADKKITRAEGAELEEKALREAQLAIALVVLARRAQKDGIVEVPGAAAADH